MRTHNLGYPRIGSQRELKHACEKYWAGKISSDELIQVGYNIRKTNWQIQQQAGIEIIPCNDFSFYDQVLDHIVAFGAIPQRFKPLVEKLSPIDLYFALSRGYQKNEIDVTALEMTKWFDTNYHYIVPEFETDQQFHLSPENTLNSFREAKQIGVTNPKPVLLGPVTFLKLGKYKGADLSLISLLNSLLPLYLELIGKLSKEGAKYIQIDEPFLCTTLSDQEQKIYHYALSELFASFPEIHFILATYFGKLDENIQFTPQNVSYTLHVDLVRCPEQLENLYKTLAPKVNLSLGIVDGRNIWKNNIKETIDFILPVVQYLGKDRVLLAPSCSLLHNPCDLDSEHPNTKLTSEVLQWLSFAKQKLDELKLIADCIEQPENTNSLLFSELPGIESRKNSSLVNDPAVQESLRQLKDSNFQRIPSFSQRKSIQRQIFNLPAFATTTIGSFPQTADVRGLRMKLKRGLITANVYEQEIELSIKNLIQWQEEIGLDVLVHGEFERNDMVEYFGEQLKGFAFTANGWVQSYGSRCVKPPIIYGDVSRPVPMTVKWTTYAQSLTTKPVKGMLTGPVTILQWSFVRNDQPRSKTAMQIALAILDEVLDLERAGISIIQVDEPAIREGLPILMSDWAKYLDWAVKAFRLSVSGVKPQTQIHTHMCYSEFNDIIEAIATMDADVITIETSRSQMELLDAFADFKYPNDIGPGVYDIHSPRVPTVQEMVELLQKAAKVIPTDQLWVNPDCGLKTRGWDETREALVNMLEAAKIMRESCNTEI